MDRNKIVILATFGVSALGIVFSGKILDRLMLGSAKQIKADAVHADVKRALEKAEAMHSGRERNNYLMTQIKYWDIVEHL